MKTITNFKCIYSGFSVSNAYICIQDISQPDRKTCRKYRRHKYESDPDVGSKIPYRNCHISAWAENILLKDCTTEVLVEITTKSYQVFLTGVLYGKFLTLWNHRYL